jgi:GDP-L-fucose synthase
MEKDARIYVAGHAGLAGSAIVDCLTQQGYRNLITRTHAELELTDLQAVARFFDDEKPEYVFLAAALVGGIHANSTYPAEFIHSNLAIQTNVIHTAWQRGVKRLLFLGSSCVYPKDAAQPMQESCLLTGPLETTNRPYALAKIAGIEMCSSYNRQYGTQYLSVMPTNLYGPGDNYHPDNSHVIPGLIRRFCDAVRDGAESVTVWGSGTPRREFMHKQDFAEACVFLMNLPDAPFQSLILPEGHAQDTTFPLINVGTGKDIPIAELAELINRLSGFQGTVQFDTSKPDGTLRKLLDVSRIHDIGWKAQISLEDGLRQTIDAFEHEHRR